MCLKNVFIEKKVTGFPAKSLEASKAENSNSLIIKLKFWVFVLELQSELRILTVKSAALKTTTTNRFSGLMNKTCLLTQSDVICLQITKAKLVRQRKML